MMLRMRLPRASLLLLVSAVLGGPSCGLAQEEPGGGQTSAAGALSGDVAGVAMHGRVLNSVTHQPIARALVTLEAYGRSVLTDNEGSFSFDGVPAGETTLTCRRPGYGEAGSGVDAGGDRVQTSIQVGAGMPALALELQPLASITGQLVLSGDDPPEDLRVQLLEKRIHEGRGQWTQVRTAQVSSDGHFRFGNLRPGSYVAHVAASMDPVPGGTPDTALDRPRTGYVATYAPGVADMAGAQVLVLGPGQAGETKIRVNKEIYYPVTARVQGAPDNGRMTFAVQGGSLLGPRYNRNDGFVHALLPSGHYVLTGHSFEPAEMAGEAEFDVRGGPVSGISIALAPVSTVPVVIRRDFTATQGVQYSQGMNPGVQVTLAREGAVTNGSVNVMHRSPAADAEAYELNGLQPGQYWAGAMVYSGYVAAMTSGGANLLQEPLSVNTSGGAQPIEVTLRNDFGSVSALLGGTLAGGSAGEDGGVGAGGLGIIPKLYLHLEPLSGTAVERIEPMPPGGQLQMTSVAPGEYLVFASAGRGPVEYHNPAVMASLASAGQSLTVAPGGTASATLDKLAVLP